MISVAFFGSHPLSEACLTQLHDHPDVSVELVVTYPSDADTWWEGSVSDLAESLGYPTRPLSEERQVLKYDVDYLVSVYYPNILDDELLDHPEEASLNLHQAELPRYRGSNVFSHAIMNAREDDHWKHGTTLHVMAEKVDAGDVVARAFVPIEETDRARDVYERANEASEELFADALSAIVSGEVPRRLGVGRQRFLDRDIDAGRQQVGADVVMRRRRRRHRRCVDAPRESVDVGHATPPRNSRTTDADGSRLFLPGHEVTIRVTTAYSGTCCPLGRSSP
nr:formyltransferase family protein [Haloprofundus halobius]